MPAALRLPALREKKNIKTEDRGVGRGEVEMEVHFVRAEQKGNSILLRLVKIKLVLSRKNYVLFLRLIFFSFFWQTRV